MTKATAAAGVSLFARLVVADYILQCHALYGMRFLIECQGRDRYPLCGRSGEVPVRDAYAKTKAVTMHSVLPGTRGSKFIA